MPVVVFYVLSQFRGKDFPLKAFQCFMSLGAGAAVGVTFAVLIILGLAAVAAFFVLKNMREK